LEREVQPDADLAGLIRAAAIPDLEQWQGGMIAPLPFEVGRRTLGELSRRGRLTGHHRELRAALSKLGRKAAEGRQATPQPFAATGHEPLDALRRELDALREPLRKGWPPDLVNTRLAMHADDDGVWFDLRIEGEETARALLLRIPPAWRGQLALDCPCGRAACIHRAVVLDQLL